MPRHTVFGLFTIIAILLGPRAGFGQGPPREQTPAQAFDGQVSMIEREVLGLAQKMPANKYDFAPATGTPPAGTFDGVRTFGLQVRHAATVMYQLSAQILGETNPVEMGTDEEAQAAIAALNGQQHGGRALTVNEAKPKEKRAGGVGARRARHRPDSRDRHPPRP